MIILYELRKRKTRAKFRCQFAANHVYRDKNSAAGGFGKSTQETDRKRILQAERVALATGKNVFPAVREIPASAQWRLSKNHPVPLLQHQGRVRAPPSLRL
jgi:hypothetical protein